MYSQHDKHCRECICPDCGLFETEKCLEYPSLCDDCGNKSHVGHCWWDTNEEDAGDEDG